MMTRALAVAVILAATPALAQPKGPDPSQETAVAADFLKRGRYEDAIRQAKLALGRDDRYVPAMVVLAKAYYYLKKYELSASIVDIAKSIDANNAECYNLLGWLALQRDDRISATAAFKKATDLDANYSAAWNSLAAQYLYAKNYQAALGAAERAAQLAPRWPKAQLNLGSAHRGLSHYKEAEQAYQQALQMDPNYAEVYFNLGILYLDARDMAGVDLIQRMNTGINYLNRYKQVASYRLTKDDPAESYIADARTAIDREQKRLDRLKKQQERNKPKTDAGPSGKVGDK
jgi:tetratricopeptide (TPR) repeat protein